MRGVKDKINWIDVFKPTEEDLKSLKKAHPFHHIILQELIRPSARSRVQKYDKYLFLVYHFPMYDSQTKTSKRAEIDILITKDTIITIHYEPMEQIDSFFQQLLRDKDLRKKVLGSNTLLPLYYLSQELIKFSARQLRHIEESVEGVGKKIFSKKNEELLRDISYIKRNILDYRLITAPQKKLFESLLEIGKDFWGKPAEIYLHSLLGEYLVVSQSLQNYFETIESLEKTNAQLLGAETNAVIKKFTILAFLFSIPLFFVFTLSIPFVSEHVLTSAAKFWTIFLSLFGLVGILSWIFKKKGIL